MNIIYQNTDEEIKVVIQPSSGEYAKPIAPNRLESITKESGGVAFEFLNKFPEIKEISFSTQRSETPDQKEGSSMMNTLLQLTNPKES